MKNAINSDETEYFYKAILTLKDTKEAADFFEAVCTPLEINTISQRLAVAKMLSENEVYLNIVAKTTASTATISRVKRSMDNSEAYDRIFKRLEKK
ncbi:MAG: TrpR YerC/YecD [Ruminococcus sp.]|jgi:TrpR-related protein YerC/YecD|nr:TrpR YerC/YecD [Ruminococcus sp.]